MLEVVDFDEELEFAWEFGTAVSGHPSVSEGLVVYPGAYGESAFWVPPSDEYLSPSVNVDDATSVYLAPVEDGVFGVADRFVQELGWLG